MKKGSVGDLMAPNPICVRPDQTVREIEALLSERGVTGAAVIDDDGRPLGVVSQHDLISHEADRTTAGESGRFYSDVDEYSDIAQVPVDRSSARIESVMTGNVYSVHRDTSIGDAAREMRRRRIHRLLVTDRGVLVGIVTSLDLLQILENDE